MIIKNLLLLLEEIGRCLECTRPGKNIITLVRSKLKRNGPADYGVKIFFLQYTKVPRLVPGDTKAKAQHIHFKLPVFTLPQ